MKLAHGIKVVASWLALPLSITALAPMLDTENPDAMPLAIAIIVCLLGLVVLVLLALVAATLIQNYLLT